jgi:hypothetical protein
VQRRMKLLSDNDNMWKGKGENVIESPKLDVSKHNKKVGSDDYLTLFKETEKEF